MVTPFRSRKSRISIATLRPLSMRSRKAAAVNQPRSAPAETAAARATISAVVARRKKWSWAIWSTLPIRAQSFSTRRISRSSIPSRRPGRARAGGGNGRGHRGGGDVLGERGVLGREPRLVAGEAHECAVENDATPARVVVKDREEGRPCQARAEREAQAFAAEALQLGIVRVEDGESGGSAFAQGFVLAPRDGEAGNGAPRGDVAQDEAVERRNGKGAVEDKLDRAVAAGLGRRGERHDADADLGGAGVEMRRHGRAERPDLGGDMSRPSSASMRSVGAWSATSRITSPRKMASLPTPSPARFSAQRWPARPRATGRFCAWTERMRAARPEGDSVTRSPGAAVPEISVPVTMAPTPARVKARSTGRRSRPAAACAAVAHSSRARSSRSSGRPSPVT